MEIERKWLIDENSIPKHLQTKGVSCLIEQHYLTITLSEEVRIRKKVDISSGGTKYTLIAKKGHGLIRDESVIVIDRDTWIRLLKLAGGEPLRKIRTYYNCELPDLGTIIIDKYLNDAPEFIGDLMVAEVEFSSEEEAKKFIPPSWFGLEVTEDMSYSNQTLWGWIQTSVANKSESVV